MNNYYLIEEKDRYSQQDAKGKCKVFISSHFNVIVFNLVSIYKILSLFKALLKEFLPYTYTGSL